MEGHIQRPDTRPIEDPAERSKIMLAKQGASTHAPGLPGRADAEPTSRNPLRLSLWWA